MTIVITDPDVGFRDKLKRRLEKITGVSVVGESHAAEETTAMIHNRKQDVAIVNTLLQDGSGIEVLHQATDGPADHHHNDRQPVTGQQERLFHRRSRLLFRQDIRR